jgi:hypothetical protein
MNKINKFLEDKVVILRPNPRSGGMITDKKHIGWFRYNGTSENFMLPHDDHNGGLMEIFESAAEREFFAKELGITADELNVRRPKNFFYGFQVKILKDDKLMTRGIEFDLSDAVDNLRWRILNKSKKVAPSYEKRMSKGKASYYFVDKGHKEQMDLKSINLESEVYAKYNEMKESTTKMYEFLFLYWLKTKKAVAPPKNPTLDYCKGQISKIIKNDKPGFLNIFTSPSLKDEMMVYQGIEANIIDYNGTKFFNVDGNEIGRKMEDVIYFYNDPVNSKEKLKLKANLKEVAKKK